MTICYDFLMTCTGWTLSKAIMRVLCNGNDEAMLTDTRYWRGEARHLEPIVIRAAVNVGWFEHKEQNNETANKIIKQAIAHLGNYDWLRV